MIVGTDIPPLLYMYYTGFPILLLGLLNFLTQGLELVSYRVHANPTESHLRYSY